MLTSHAEKLNSKNQPLEKFKIHEDFQIVILTECDDMDLSDFLDQIPHDRNMTRITIPSGKKSYSKN